MTDLEKVADSLLSELEVRQFPEDYLSNTESMEEFRLPESSDVMMYRELEGVFVLFDYERIFFKDPYEAKYVYYCAKRGISKIRMPATKELKRLLKDFQSDLENLRYRLEEKASLLGLSDDEKDRLVEICSRKMGYFDIMDI